MATLNEKTIAGCDLVIQGSLVLREDLEILQLMTIDARVRSALSKV